MVERGFGCRKKRMQEQIEQPKSKFARRYDAEFKRNAVALVKSGRSAKAVAGDLGASSWSLRCWLTEANNGQPLG